MKKRSLLDYAVLSLKGMAVGAVEFLPGISGGTIAFVIGIYQELLNTIKGALPAFKQLFGKKSFIQRITDFWTAFNGNFVVALAFGMIVAIAATVSLVKHLLVNYPLPFYGFVFGLIIASIVLVSKKIRRWTWVCYALSAVGIAIAFALPIQPHDTSTIVPLWYFFICSALASCAFIMPGTSGTFVLLLMGAYHTLVVAIKDFNVTYIAVYIAGCLTGLVAFSNVLSWLLKRYHDKVVALMTGFIIGSLRIIWPWKKTVCEGIDADGVSLCETVGNALPNEMVVVTATTCVAGIIIVLGIELIAKQFSKKSSL
ncbi:MAG: DUF368 domain-containing protein [Bacteroidales bacterium]|nr:DUF368 domain-containing protein [Bacteroidales bacterium]